MYRRYGRRNAAQVANVISYRPRSAVRDMAKALGYSTGQQDAWSKQIDSWGTLPISEAERIAGARRPPPPAPCWTTRFRIRLWTWPNSC